MGQQLGSRQLGMTSSGHCNGDPLPRGKIVAGFAERKVVWRWDADEEDSQGHKL